MVDAWLKHRGGILLAGVLLCCTGSAIADPATAVPDLVRVNAPDDSGALLESDPKNQDLEQLLLEAQRLFIENRSIDARSKLQKALQIAPLDYRPHMQLGAYYLVEVGHFRLAYQYLKNAESLFEKKYGSDTAGTLSPEAWRENAKLLALLSESELNLDRYQQALDTLDRFAKNYWDSWYPGTRAWVLMKLKRVDEAITVAQAGLLRDAEPGRTYNILGILLSVKDNREDALRAFALAIRSELALGGLGQVATPLNNAGEVYRELFNDEQAEASWLKATQLKDGCDHILPSLNLSILYVDELKLFQAERVLDDFVACYAQRSTRSDTEHRSLLALQRGRILLRKGDIDNALDQLTHASEREQWFGKIGTNENDVRFAATIALSDALSSKVATLRDTIHSSVLRSLQQLAQIPFLEFRSWWLARRGREIAIDELSDFEDLHIRNTDAMIEYPTLGTPLSGFPTNSLEARLKTMIEIDDRPLASAFYKLYLAKHFVRDGDYDRAVDLLNELDGQFRPIDRLAESERLALLIVAEAKSKYFWSSVSADERQRSIQLREKLFALLPSHLRYYDLQLPVTFTLQADSAEEKDLLDNAKDELTSVRFEELPEKGVAKFDILLAGSSDGKSVTLTLREASSGTVLSTVSGETSMDEAQFAEFLNKFINKTFAHRSDPPAEPVARLELLDSIRKAP